MLKLNGMMLRGRRSTGVRGLLLFIRYYPDRVLIPLLFLVTFFTVFYYGHNSQIYSINDDTLQVSGDAETCTFTSNVTSAHTKTINPGSTQSGIGTTKITTKCTNSIEHKVYAIGYSNNTDGNTNLINSADNVTIATGTATSGNVSNWAMLIAKDSSSYQPSNLTITNSFGSYHAVPSTSTQIAGYTGATDSTTGSSITTTYRAKMSDFQLAGTYVGKVKYTLAATMYYSATIKTSTGISKVTLNGVECTSTSGCVVTNLTEGETYTLVATLETGYNFGSWSTPENGTISSSTSASTSYVVGGGDSTITPSATPKSYTITLNGNGATTAGSTSTTVSYKATTLGTITNPQRKYTISGFTLPASNNATGATVSSTSTLTSTYTFNGWYKESAATNKIATNATTPVLSSSTSYTNANGEWTYDGARTLYAGWTAQQKTLPTIRKDGYNCGWTETATNATEITYQTGGTLTPAKNYTLYGVCTPIEYTVTLRAGSGVSAIDFADWTGTGTTTLTKTFHYGDTIDLSGATLTLKTGYNGASYTRNETYGTLSGSTYTVGLGNGDISLHAGGLDAPTCSMKGGATKVYNNGSTTLTATSNSANYDTDSVKITYSFGYASAADGTLGNFGSAQTGNTISIAANLYKGTRYYGVTVTVTDKNNSSLTNTCTSGTGSSTGSTVANRTTQVHVNSRINFNATANGGTLVGSTPRYVYYNGTAVYSGRTNSTAASFPTATPPTGYVFDGWFTAQTGGYKVLNSDATLTGTAVSGWTDSSSPQKWLRTSTSTSSTANVLYAQYSPIPYVISLTADESTYAGSTSATVIYGSNSVTSALDLPKKEYTISGFTLPSAYKANGATVSSSSAVTYAWTLVGWSDRFFGFSDVSLRTVSAYGTMYLNPDGTFSPDQACTDSEGKWNCEGSNDTELDAQFAINENFTLPTITKDGYTCGWTDLATGATTIKYPSGGSNIYPEANVTLYGICKGLVSTITLEQNGATTNGSTTAYAAYGDTILHGKNPDTPIPDTTLTNPQRKYTISGFTLPSTNNATGATVSSSSTLTSTYTFNGWYQEAAATHKIASNAGNPVLQASTSYTNASGEWTSRNNQTLFAGWTAQQKTLPTIHKDGYNCGWTETSTNATSITYSSGGTLTPAKNYTLYGVCTPINYTVTITAGTGINSLTSSGWTGTGTGTISKTYHYGDTIDLSAITKDYLTGFNGATYTKTDSVGSLSGSTYTVGAGNGAIAIKAGGLDTPICTMQGGTTKIYNRSATTLTATDTSSLYEANSVNITYSFGYATSTSGTLGNFGTAQAGNTLSVAKAAFYGTRYYGVTVNVTSVDDSTITATCTSGTGSSSGTTVANRTTMSLINSRVQLNAGDGTLSGTAYFYVAYGKANKYSSRTATTAYTLPTVTPPEDYVLDGWYTAAEGGSKVMNADFSLTGTAVSGWSNASSVWVKTGTSDSSTSTANLLYAHYTFNGTYIQNLPSSSCTTTARKVYDIRDMQPYWVKRLDDGNCWMLENLNLGETDLTTDLTSSNTNLSDTVTAATFNGWKKTTGTNSLTTGEFRSLSGSDTTSNTKYGVLYNYHAATVGNVTGSSVTLNSPYDICPAGWRLPTGGQYGEYDILTQKPAFDTVAELRAPIASGGFGLAFSGYVGVGDPYYIGQIGTYWSSTRVNSTNMYYMSVNSSTISPTFSTSRGYMQSVRCVLKKTSHLVTVNFDSGIDHVVFNGVNVMNGWGVILDDNAYYKIEATPKSGYTFNSFSATGGSFISASSASTYYLSGTGAYTINVTSGSATYTCTKQYRLQNADGTYPSTYTVDSVETLPAGSICDYVKSYTNYQTQSDNRMPIDATDVTLSLDLPRNTYTLTVYKYASISTAGNGGTYRWGQEVQLTATPNLAEGYRFYQWAHYNSENEGTFSSTTIANPTYTMPIGNASIVASGRKNYFQERQYSYCGYPMWDYRTNTSYKTVIINTWCYMAENLDLPGGTTVEPTHSHVTSSYTLPSSSTGASTGVYNSGTRDCSSGGPCYSYYNWTVATAGTNPTFGMAESDICPKYWRLLQQNDLDRISSYHYTNQIPLTSAPFEGNASGLYSTAGSYNNSNTIMFWAGANHYVGPGNARSGYAYNATSATYFGNAQYLKDVRAGVRCVMANTNTLSSATTMQSVAPDMILNSANGATATLTDSRNTSVSYGVLKAVNSLWMTDNLKVLGGATISNTASNITSSTSYTLPASVTSPAYWTNSNTSAVLYTGTASTTGGYYNHVAATATIQNTTAANNASVMNQPMQSICPRPWRIPTYHELADLVSSYGTQMINLLGLAKNGYIAAGGLSMSGSYGFWWTMTTSATDATKAYILTESPSNALTLQLVDKFYGANIRCIYNS